MMAMLDSHVLTAASRAEPSRLQKLRSMKDAASVKMARPLAAYATKMPSTSKLPASSSNTEPKNKTKWQGNSTASDGLCHTTEDEEVAYASDNEQAAQQEAPEGPKQSLCVVVHGEPSPTRLSVNRSEQHALPQEAACLRGLTFEFTRLRRRVKPAVGRRVQRRVRPRSHLLPCPATDASLAICHWNSGSKDWRSATAP